MMKFHYGRPIEKVHVYREVNESQMLYMIVLLL